ncbi:MAG: hypothetical protein ACRD44_13300 [Bryobacteraceae bacterium]
MDWNEAAADLLHQILQLTPRPERDQAERQIRAIAESLAEEDGVARVGVNTVVRAWMRNTPETLRAELSRRMEMLGLDPDDFPVEE